MPLISGLRALHFGATCAIGGAVGFDLLVLGRGGRALPEATAQPVRRALRRVAAASVVVALLTWCGWLALVAIGMSGLPPAQALTPAVLRTLVARTTFGHTWVVRLVLLLVAAPCLPRAAPVRRGFGVRDALAAAVGTALVASLAASGHALGAGTAHLWVDAAHLLGAALWLGMLPPLLTVVRRATLDAPPGAVDLAAAAVRRFSPPAMLAVIVLTLTGVANARWLVGSLRDLGTTPYGMLLLLKLSLFALMLLLAVANRVRWTPRLNVDGPPAADRLLALRHLRRNVAAELLLGAAVLALVGVLGVTPPPAHEPALHRADAPPSS